ncbi:MAG: pyrroline-5-carboxylate reductase [Campylobacterales bacterium]
MPLYIFGSGKMALAIAKSLAKKEDLVIVGRDKDRLLEFQKKSGAKSITTYQELKNIDALEIIVAVKPYAIKELFSTLKGEAKAIYSVAAGFSIDALKSSVDAKGYIRVMPNVAASVQKSMTSISGDASLKQRACDIFSQIGQTMWFEKESMIDVSTPIAGSSPAFLAVVAEALIDGAVKEGLDRDSATKLVQGSFEGFAETLKHRTPSEIKNEVMSPAGTTAEGIYELEKGGVRAAFMSCVKSTFLKTKALKG